MMPAPLDLSRAAHTKMIIAPPRINLRRAASYNKHDAPLSSSSSRFNFNHLVFASPPPSPGLPSLSPPLQKPRKGLRQYVRPTRVIRLVIWAFTSYAVFYFTLSTLTYLTSQSSPVSAVETREAYEMVGQDDLPDFPTPIAMTEKRGKAKWTMLIPTSLEFPLRPDQYTDLCQKCREVSERVHSLHSHSSGLAQNYLHFGKGSSDHSFVDVQEAETAGLLPGLRGSDGAKAQLGDLKPLLGEATDGTVKPVCQKSMTFVLESQDAGMGHSLLLLWTAYSLAQKEDRAFFIDDSRWAYGNYTDTFQPPPTQNCQLPPRHHMVPCPRQARHLVVSAATATTLFENSRGVLEDEDKDMATEAMFGLAREGYEALFKLTKDDRTYVDRRVREMVAKKIVPKSKGGQNGLAVGLHVRRGDRRPFEFQYQDSYLPLTSYVSTAREMFDDRFNHTGPHGAEDRPAKDHSFLLVASDDPIVFESMDKTNVQVSLAQERIKLASKQVIQSINPDRHVMRKFVDETFGWEGGFFSAMFWNLGSSGAGIKNPVPPSPDTVRLRSLLGRAYMIDLAVLADASDAVVCTVSAMGCRILAVMMGWDHAMVKGNWINIDGGYGWMGVA